MIDEYDAVYDANARLGLDDGGNPIPVDATPARVYDDAGNLIAEVIAVPSPDGPVIGWVRSYQWAEADPILLADSGWVRQPGDISF